MFPQSWHKLQHPWKTWVWGYTLYSVTKSWTTLYSTGGQNLNSTLEVVAGLPRVEVRFSILASLHCCLVVFVGSVRGECSFYSKYSTKYRLLMWSIGKRGAPCSGINLFNLSRQLVCSLVTLGHSELGWAQRWLGRARKKSTFRRFCTIVTNSLSRLGGLQCSRKTLQQNPFR